jgi:hypothetical protein
MLSCRPFPRDASSHRPNGHRLNGTAWDSMGVHGRQSQSGCASRLSAPAKGCQTACKPGSVRTCVRDDHSSGTRLAARLTRPTRTAERESPCAVLAQPSLFGLAPGGVYPAAPVARGAVRSCRTVSPLPAGCLAALARAVCFLWHCPWGRPRRALPGTVFPWSPDFPLSPHDDSGRPAVWRRHSSAEAAPGSSPKRRTTVVARRWQATWPLRGFLPAPRAHAAAPERPAESGTRLYAALLVAEYGAAGP